MEWILLTEKRCTNNTNIENIIERQTIASTEYLQVFYINYYSIWENRKLYLILAVYCVTVFPTTDTYFFISHTYRKALFFCFTTSSWVKCDRKRWGRTDWFRKDLTLVLVLIKCIICEEFFQRKDRLPCEMVRTEGEESLTNS